MKNKTSINENPQHDVKLPVSGSLPTDEEIHRLSKDVEMPEHTRIIWIMGAKWLRDLLGNDR